jgi:hypothetical protein
VKIVMTLVVRDEAEIICDQLDYHLAAGVDFVIATDHRSTDGTREILEEYERSGRVRLLREDGEFVKQGAWQTRMARLASLEHDADWIVASDADEFWWPRGASIEESLEAVPDGVGVVRAFMQNFVPVREDHGWFVERMIFRFSPFAPVNDPATPYRPAVKVAHRADPGAVFPEGGAHHISGVPGRLLTSWHPFDLLHFPLRSRKQCERKYRKTWTGWESNLRADLARAAGGAAGGRADPVWNGVALDEIEVARGLDEGSIVVDTRLRDALLAVRGVEHSPESPPRTAQRGARAIDVAVFAEAELVRRARWVSDLEARVRRIETAPRRFFRVAASEDR